MYELEVMNKANGNIEIIYGYSFDDALRRRNWNEEDWKLLSKYYID